MSNLIIATRYAKSLLQLASEKGAEKAIYDDMILIENTCVESRELELLLKSPIVKAQKKIAILDAVFKDQIHKISQNFIDIIARNKREALLYDIAIAFQNQYKIKNDILTATVTTAVGLDANTKSAVLQLIKNSAKSEVELIERTDADIIGGLILRIGDKQYDGSLQRRLSDLKQEFGENYLAN